MRRIDPPEGLALPLLVPAALLAVLMPGDREARASSNPWLELRPLAIAHQGGVHESPSNTLYAFKRAIAAGADALELDIHQTADGALVVVHDDTVQRTTGAPGFVRDLTVAQLQALDAAHCWHPGAGDRCDEAATGGDYPLRGVATGQKPPPAGFAPADFRIPTLDEMLGMVRSEERERGRDVLLEIEIKYNPEATGAGLALPYEDAVAKALASPTYGRHAANTVVAATTDDVVERFRVAAAVRGAAFSTNAPTAATALFLASSLGDLPGLPSPLYQVLAVPVSQDETGLTVIDPAGDFVRDAHANGLAVHAWTINEPDEMRRLLDLGVDGIITDRPSLLRAVIDSR